VDSCLYIIKPRENIDYLYVKHGIMRFEDVNSYLIGRFMHRCNCGTVPKLFVSYFSQNKNFHPYATRTAHHLHLPPVSSELAKSGIRYRGAVIWNIILSDYTNVNVSEAVFKHVLKRLLAIGMLPPKTQC